MSANLSKTLQYEEDDDDDLLLRRAERVAIERERNAAFEQTQPQPQPPQQQQLPEVLPPLTDLSQAPVLPYNSTVTASHHGRQTTSHVSFLGQSSSGVDTPKNKASTINRNPTPSHRAAQTQSQHRRVETDPSTLIAQVRTRLRTPTHPVYICSRYDHFTVPLYTPYLHTLLTRSRNRPSQHTLSTHLLNTPSHHTFSPHLLNTPSQHTFLTHLLNTPSQHTFSSVPLNKTHLLITTHFPETNEWMGVIGPNLPVEVLSCAHDAGSYRRSAMCCMWAGS